MATAGGGIGGGIAGVASKYEADSIKIYNERQKYNEWEFIYDYTKDKRRMAAGGAQMGAGGPLSPQVTGAPGRH